MIFFGDKLFNSFFCRGEIADYGTETSINLNHELYYHVLGTDQSEDILCWKDPKHPRYRFYPRVTDDGKVTKDSRFFSNRILCTYQLPQREFGDLVLHSLQLENNLY